MNISAIRPPKESLLLLGELLAPPRRDEQLELELNILSNLGAIEASPSFLQQSGLKLGQLITDVMVELERWRDSFSLPLRLSSDQLVFDAERPVLRLSDLWRSDAFIRQPLAFAPIAEAPGTLLQLSQEIDRVGGPRLPSIDVRLGDLPQWISQRISQGFGARSERLERTKPSPLPFEALRQPYERPAVIPKERQQRRAFQSGGLLKKLFGALKGLLSGLASPFASSGPIKGR